MRFLLCVLKQRIKELLLNEKLFMAEVNTVPCR